MPEPTRSSSGIFEVRGVPFAWLALGVGLCLPATLHGQLSTLQMEVNGGVSTPVEQFAGAEGWEGEASGGASFGVHFQLNSGHLGYRVGFSEHRFGCPLAGCGTQTDVVSTAWDMGLHLNLRTSGIVPWLHVGAVASISQVEGTAAGSASTERLESDRGWGFEAGAGLLIPVASRVGLNPGVRYGRIDLDWPGRGVLRERYVVVDLGLVLGF